METHKIEAHKITKSIQLMAVWFVSLIFIDSAFLIAAAKINIPTWIAPTLVISAIAFVPLFVIAVFLMQTVFRKELQDDQFYSEWWKNQEKIFKDFSPENISAYNTINERVSGYLSEDKNFEISKEDEDLEKKRIKLYEDKKGLFLVHSWRPSFIPGQVSDIVIWLQQHGKWSTIKWECRESGISIRTKVF